MSFDSLRLFNFRNLQDAVVSVDAPEVYLVGENGQGKTNFLEGIYLLCFGSSFRTNKELELIRYEESDMSVNGSYRSSGGEGYELSIKLQHREKKIFVDGKIVKDRKELLEKCPCIVFSHEDIGFVNGAPERRRRFFNQTMSLNHPLFVDTLRRYNRIIKARNAALKENNGGIVSVYDEQAATIGMELQRARQETIERFNRWFTPLFEEVSKLGVEVTIRYIPSWKKAEDVEGALAILENRRNFDYNLGVTSTGPHRDRFVFIADERNFAATASTGQLRLMSLVLKVSQARFHAEVTGKLAIFLLDDVLLELDAIRRRRFLSLLPIREQAFFTFLPDEHFDSYKSQDTLVYRINEGRVLST